MNFACIKIVVWSALMVWTYAVHRTGSLTFYAVVLAFTLLEQHQSAWRADPVNADAWDEDDFEAEADAT